MNQKLLLIDFENVHKVDLSRLDDGIHVIIFAGSAQNSIPFDMVASAQKLGARVEWQKVEGNGSNSLDFHIACHLGRVLEQSPRSQCIVLSQDKGFDPLLRHLNKLGLKCRRINSVLDLDPKPSPVDDPNYRRVIEILGKCEKKTRPRKTETLSQHISSIFQRNITREDVDRIIQMLFANKMISETNNSITYSF